MNVIKQTIVFSLLLCIIFDVNINHSRTKSITIQKLIGGSTILIFFEKEYLVIAADSKQVAVSMNRADSNTYELACKILHVDNFFYAITGYYKFTNSDYDVEQYIKDAIAEHRILSSVVSNVRNKVTTPLKKICEKIKAENPPFFNTLVDKGILQIFFGRFENDSLCRETLNYKLRLDNNEQIYIEEKILEKKENRGVIPLGEADMIKKQLKEDKNFLGKGDAISIIDFLISMEIRAHPDKVGPPIDIVLITKDGYEWLRKKQDCN